MKKEHFIYLFLLFAVVVVAPYTTWYAACVFSLFCTAIAIFFAISMLLEKRHSKATQYYLNIRTHGFPINAVVGSTVYDKNTSDVWIYAPGKYFPVWRRYDTIVKESENAA